MDKNFKDADHTRHISRRVNLVRNGENWKVHKIYWFEGGLLFTDIATKNIGDDNLNPNIKYIVEMIYNW